MSACSASPAAVGQSLEASEWPTATKTDKCRHWDEENSNKLNGPRSRCDVGVSAGTGLCCRRRLAAGAVSMRGGFLGRGLAGCCRSSGSTQRTRRARTHGLHEHDDGHGALAGTLRWQRRLCCWTHAVRRRLSTHRAPSDDCACSCCGTEGWVSAAGIVWDWAGSESGQAWRETRLSTMRRGAGLEWVDENVRRAAESSGRHIVEGSRTPAWSEDAAH